MNKTYTKPSFSVIRQSDSNKVFFAGSGTAASSASGSIGGMTTTGGSW